MTDPTEQELIKAVAEADRKATEADIKWAVAYRNQSEAANERDKATREWIEASIKLYERKVTNG